MSSSALLALGLLMLFFIHAPASPSVEVTSGRGATKIVTVTAGRTVTLDITSDTGIGSATVTLGKARPERLVLRLHLKGLEHFSLTQGNTELGMAVSSATEHPAHRWVTRLDDPKHAEEPVAEGNPLWMPMRTGDGCFAIEAPKTVLEGKEATLTVRWIDFYRE